MLPKAPNGFEWVELAGGPALVCRGLADQAPHFFTTRQWSLGAAGAVNGRWRAVADAAGVSQLLRLKQIHGAEVVVHRRGAPIGPELPAADIIVSDDEGAAIAVQAADCVPLLIADRVTGAVAAAHGGWRGLLAGVPAAAVNALVRRFGSRPEDLIAAIGPSIGACCYEVGDEVRNEFTRQTSNAEAWFHDGPAAIEGNPPYRDLRPRAGRWFFDGWAAARDQLLAAGIPGDRVHVAALCTASHAGAFCSYRRDGTGAGRIAGVIRARA